MAGYDPLDTERSPRPAAHLIDLDDELDLVRLIPNPTPKPKPNPNPYPSQVAAGLMLTELGMQDATLPSP